MKCLVLGGTGYIGSELCKKLSLEGHEVFFTWHKNKVLAESLAESFESGKGFQADFRTDCKELFNTIINEMNGINALIQCAGTAGNVDIYQKRADKFQDISAKDFNEMMSITVSSTFAASQAAALEMKKFNGGQVIIIGSMDGVKPVPAPIHYAAAKGALVAITSTLAKELGKDNICVNLIAPGMLMGGLAKYLSEELKNEYLHHCSMSRLGNAEEVADLALWLVNKNTYLTGQTLLLDGAL